MRREPGAQIRCAVAVKTKIINRTCPFCQGTGSDTDMESTRYERSRKCGRCYGRRVIEVEVPEDYELPKQNTEKLSYEDIAQLRKNLGWD